MVEGLQAALGNAPAGVYASALALPGLTVNQNLLGFVPLVNRRNEAKNFFLNIGITNEEFAENPVNSRLNRPSFNSNDLAQVFDVQAEKIFLDIHLSASINTSEIQCLFNQS